jgi:choline dehydrogenase-like flavoprotein
MDMNKYKPDNLEKKWDVIVIGAGMGGGVFGYEMAKTGKEVLFLESGYFLSNALEECNDSKDVCVRKKNGQWPYKVKGNTTFGQRNSFLSIGCGTGGSTSIYAAQLERMFPSDFSPKRNYPDSPDANLPEKWPINYQDFERFYQEAERLFRVTGGKDFFSSDINSKLTNPPQLTNSNKKLFKYLTEVGLHPYRSHVACDFVEGCDGCAEVICKKRCKNDVNKICIEPALIKYNAKILTSCDVTRIDANDKTARFVECKVNKKIVKLQGRVIVLAAGAIFTPELLLKSSSDIWPNGLCNSNGLVGKNLMWHASDVFAIKPKKASKDSISKRQISFNDFYFIDNFKCGNIQEMGFNWFTREKLREIILRKLSKFGLKISKNSFIVRIVSFFAEYRFKGATMYASIVEDLPYLENMVYLQDGEVCFKYTYKKELRNRCKALRLGLAKTIKSKYKLLLLSKRDNLNYGHACGTCRFGDSPTSSVINADNRAHDISNLFIVDASFFPSSGGSNPSLTIAANSIRVAEFVNSEWDSFV